MVHMSKKLYLSDIPNNTSLIMIVKGVLSLGEHGFKPFNGLVSHQCPRELCKYGFDS